MAARIVSGLHIALTLVAATACMAYPREILTYLGGLAVAIIEYHRERLTMSTPNPLPGGIPVTGHNVLETILHTGLTDIAGPLATYFAAAQAASKAESTEALTAAKVQLVGNVIAAEPHLFGDVLAELFAVGSYGLSKIVAPVTPAAAPAPAAS